LRQRIGRAPSEARPAAAHSSCRAPARSQPGLSARPASAPPRSPCPRGTTTLRRRGIDDSKTILQKAGELATAWLSQWSGGVETAKTFISSNVADEVCDVLNDTQSCRDKVGAAIKTGINVGLASLGIPPEIPDIQQLREHGIGYVAAQAASHALGNPEILNSLPVDETLREQLYQQAYDKAVDELTKALNEVIPPTQFDSKNPATWGTSNLHMRPTTRTPISKSGSGLRHTRRIYVSWR
jgi:hypothetical protein